MQNSGVANAFFYFWWRSVAFGGAVSARSMATRITRNNLLWYTAIGFLRRGFIVNSVIANAKNRFPVTFSPRLNPSEI
jgi:hypothetical protein